MSSPQIAKYSPKKATATTKPPKGATVNKAGKPFAKSSTKEGKK